MCIGGHNHWTFRSRSKQHLCKVCNSGELAICYTKYRYYRIYVIHVCNGCENGPKCNLQSQKKALHNCISWDNNSLQYLVVSSNMHPKRYGLRFRTIFCDSKYYFSYDRHIFSSYLHYSKRNATLKLGNWTSCLISRDHK